MKLSVVIVNYNGAHFLTQCLDSVFSSRTTFPFEVIVVDNQSTDGSRALLDAYDHSFVRVYLDQNKGFSAGNNAGVRHATGEMLLLLNNDTVVSPTTFQLMMDYMMAHPETGALAPKLLNGDGSLQTPGSLLMRWAYWGSKPRKVSFIAGAAVMMTASLYKELGGLDEHYFFYNEDLDLCKSILKLGRSIVYDPAASLVHFGGLSTRSRRRGSILEGYRGGLYFCKKHYGGWFYIYKWLLLVDVVPRWVWHVLLGLGSASYKEMAHGYADVIGLVVLNRPLVAERVAER